MRIESALFVKRITVCHTRVSQRSSSKYAPQTKHEFNGHIWLGFERLTCVPIQTKMVNAEVLSKEEKQWIKVRLFPRQMRLGACSLIMLRRTTTAAAWKCWSPTCAKTSAL